MINDLTREVRDRLSKKLAELGIEHEIEILADTVHDFRLTINFPTQIEHRMLGWQEAVRIIEGSRCASHDWSPLYRRTYDDGESIERERIGNKCSECGEQEIW